MHIAWGHDDAPRVVTTDTAATTSTSDARRHRRRCCTIWQTHVRTLRRELARVFDAHGIVCVRLIADCMRITIAVAYRRNCRRV
jgi:N-formylglutamate amidohydrolase